MRRNFPSESAFFHFRTLTGCTLCAAATLLAALSFAATPPRISKAAALSKIAPWVFDHTANGNEAEVLVVLADHADLSGATKLRTKKEKSRHVRDALWTKAQTSQAPLLKWLQDRHVEHRAFYIVNVIWVKAGNNVIQALATRSDVARIEGNPLIHNTLPQPIAAAKSMSPNAPDETRTVEPGINYTRAPEVWAMGITGQGIVVGGGDTGYRWDHTALKNHYRGWDNNTLTANHDYNWHDSIHNAVVTNTCGSNSAAPCDDDGHGTHTMGTAVGDDGLGNQIGMAPGAKWIGCRNMDAGVGTPARYIECFEFFLAPYPVNGTPAQGDPSKAPDLTTNSWGCPTDEGCTAGNELKAAVEAQRAAGIMTMVAAGNAGSGCSTVNDQPAIFDASYSIGALTTGSDNIASFSSRGPVTLDGSGRLKPDLCAPGTSTRSSSNTTPASYASLSGTSMATPHVAGAVALLWSAQPSLQNDIDNTEAVLNQTAVHLSSTACSSPQTSPNNVFGYGRLDIKAAVDAARLLKLNRAVSRKTHAATPYDVDLPLTNGPGIECRSSAGNHTLVFTFSNNVISGNASITSGVGAISGSPTFSGNTMTVNLSGVADVQKITVKLSAVTDAFSQVLPDTTVTMGVLPGDTTADGFVNSADISQTKSQSGISLTTANFREDLTVEGNIDSTDIALVKSKSGTALP